MGFTKKVFDKYPNYKKEYIKLFSQYTFALGDIYVLPKLKEYDTGVILAISKVSTQRRAVMPKVKITYGEIKEDTCTPGTSRFNLCKNIYKKIYQFAATTKNSVYVPPIYKYGEYRSDVIKYCNILRKKYMDMRTPAIVYTHE